MFCFVDKSHVSAWHPPQSSSDAGLLRSMEILGFLGLISYLYPLEGDPLIISFEYDLSNVLISVDLDKLCISCISNSGRSYIFGTYVESSSE
jgi:hypothetical protein